MKRSGVKRAERRKGCKAESLKGEVVVMMMMVVVIFMMVMMIMGASGSERGSPFTARGPFSLPEAPFHSAVKRSGW